MEKQERSDEAAIQAAAERIVEVRLKQARQDEVVATYEDLLQTIWNRLVPTLGRVTVTAILERSADITAGRFPFMQAFRVSREGVSFRELRSHLETQDQHCIREAMKDLVANLIDLLAVLTGDIIVRQLLKDVEGTRS
jgi:hypothetical protein